MLRGAVRMHLYDSFSNFIKSPLEFNAISDVGQRPILRIQFVLLSFMKENSPVPLKTSLEISKQVPDIY